MSWTVCLPRFRRHCGIWEGGQTVRRPVVCGDKWYDVHPFYLTLYLFEIVRGWGGKWRDTHHPCLYSVLCLLDVVRGVTGTNGTTQEPLSLEPLGVRFRCCGEPRDVNDRKDSKPRSDSRGVGLRPRVPPSSGTVQSGSGTNSRLVYHQRFRFVLGSCRTTRLTRLTRVTTRVSVHFGSVSVTTGTSKDRSLYRGFLRTH